MGNRFASHRRRDNSRFHSALSDHLASVEHDPALPRYFEYAITANERGRGLVDLIAQRQPLQGVHALDIGCAYGGMLVAFAERGCSVTGIDINASLLALGRENLADQGISAPLLNRDAAASAPDFEAAFDVIVACDVIEHVRHLDTFLDNLALWLRAGGRAYLEIPNGKAVDAVLCDGHHELFGLTLLDYPEAAAYVTAIRGREYDTYHYLSLDEYVERFRARALDAEVLERTWEGITVEGLRAALEKLASTAGMLVNGVPEPIRPAVSARLAEYLHEVRHGIDSLPDAEVLLRYGSSFWTVELTERSG